VSWFKLDDQGAFHEKVLQAGNEAYGAWCRAGQWSSGRRTEGLIPKATALSIAPLRVWKKLVAARGRSQHGLIEEAGDDFQIHDYLEWNPTTEAIEAKRAARSEAGRAGGLRSAATRQATTKQTSKQLLQSEGASAPASNADDASSLQESGDFEPRLVETQHSTGNAPESHETGQAIASANAQANPKQTSTPSPSPSPSLNPQISLTGDLGPAPSEAKRKKAKRAQTTPWPEGFTVSPAIAQMCRAEGLPNPFEVIKDFEGKARAKAYVYADWEAAFRTWMRSKITRENYPAWPAERDPESRPFDHGPPAKMTPELLAQIARIANATGSKPKGAIAQMLMAPDEGANVFLPESKVGAGS